MPKTQYMFIIIKEGRSNGQVQDIRTYTLGPRKDTLPWILEFPSCGFLLFLSLMSVGHLAGLSHFCSHSLAHPCGVHSTVDCSVPALG